ncbi:MAG: DUF302 domain-containing protein [Bacteroidales bacterium]
MKYYISQIFNSPFNHILGILPDLLSQEGFGIITQIDVKDTLRKKLDIDYKNYVILGACNPQLALRAFQAEDKIGTLLPCNVIVIDQGDGTTEVAYMDSVTLMGNIGNPELELLAKEANERLGRVMHELKHIIEKE